MLTKRFAHNTLNYVDPLLQVSDLRQNRCHASCQTKSTKNTSRTIIFRKNVIFAGFCARPRAFSVLDARALCCRAYFAYFPGLSATKPPQIRGAAVGALEAMQAAPRGQLQRQLRPRVFRLWRWRPYRGPAGRQSIAMGWIMRSLLGNRQAAARLIARSAACCQILWKRCAQQTLAAIDKHFWGKSSPVFTGAVKTTV